MDTTLPAVSTWVSGSCCQWEMNWEDGGACWTAWQVCNQQNPDGKQFHGSKFSGHKQISGVKKKIMKEIVQLVELKDLSNKQGARLYY